jgi:hypothetical protein
MQIKPLIATVFIGAAAGFGATPAGAACYEDVGCTNRNYFSERDLYRLAGCDILWEMRNTIYAERGYCFQSSRGISTFGNAGCRHDRPDDVPLNDAERANVATIAAVERAKSCPR